jgi:hypothetical protein
VTLLRAYPLVSKTSTEVLHTFLRFMEMNTPLFQMNRQFIEMNKALSDISSHSLLWFSGFSEMKSAFIEVNAGPAGVLILPGQQG